MTESRKEQTYDSRISYKDISPDGVVRIIFGDDLIRG